MRKFILSLIGLNLALAGYLAFALSHATARPAAMAANDATAAAGGSALPVKRASAAQSQTSGKLTWAGIASSDLGRYAENLRRVGCPEQTIKDIMLAEVNRRYAPLELALKVRPDDVAPWERLASYDRRSGESKLRQLLEEKRTLLKDLTGVDVGIDMPSRLAGRDVEKFEGAFSALPEAKRDQVRAIQENYWAQSDDIKQRTMGYLEPEDRDEFLQIKTERRDALAKVLTPRELQDYELQTSDTAATLRSRLKGLDLTDDEFRKVFDYTQPLDERYSLGRRNPDPVNQDFTAARSQAEKDVQDYVRSVVGDDRYADYERSQDPVYRSISQAGAQAGLSQEMILQAYQAQQQMQAESQRVLQDPALTPEQRVRSLNDMRAQAQQRLQQILGDQSAQFIQQLPSAQLGARYGIQPIPNPGAASGSPIAP
jgi:hypothetical protein